MSLNAGSTIASRRRLGRVRKQIGVAKTNAKVAPPCLHQFRKHVRDGMMVVTCALNMLVGESGLGGVHEWLVKNQMSLNAGSTIASRGSYGRVRKQIGVAKTKAKVAPPCLHQFRKHVRDGMMVVTCALNMLVGESGLGGVHEWLVKNQMSLNAGSTIASRRRHGRVRK